MSNELPLLKVVSPYSGDVIDSLSYDSWSEVDRWLTRSYRLSRQRPGVLSIEKRINILEKARNLVTEKKDRIALQASQEGGKPLTDSLVEVERGIDGIGIALAEMRTLHGVEIPMGLTNSSQGRWAFTRREPVGVVLAFSAFNHPFNLVVHQVIPAIAVGCPVIVKPARQTPLSCRALIEILYDSGLPEDWCRMVIGDHQLGEQLVRDSRLAHWSFVGSGEVGWKLRSSLAPGVECSLEHGGLAPVIMAEDADYASALPLLLKGGFYHAGQVCVSVQRIFVHESKARNFARQLAEGADVLRVGDPTDSLTEVGPLIHARELRRVDDWVNEAVQTGAELMTGGKILGQNCYRPTVLYNPPEATRVSRHEIFGPVVAVYPYKELDEAIAKANQVPYVFQSSVFTQNIHCALKCCNELESTTVMVNDHPAFRVDWMPFGGRRNAGMGVGGIPYTMKELSYEKLFVWKSDALG